MLQIAEANTIPMETTEEQLLRSEPLGSEQGTTETKCYSRQTSLSQREKDTKHTQGFYNTEKDHCKIKAAQDIVAHPVVRLDGLITIVRRRLKQEVSITVAPYVLRVSYYYICYLSLAEWYCRCGKIGHINKNCMTATKKRAQRQTMTGTNNLAINETSSILPFYRFNFLNLVNFLSSIFKKRNKKQTTNSLSILYLSSLYRF